MKITAILTQQGSDFTATMECEHCGHTAELTSGYHDGFYHARVIPAMRCTSCGKNRAGELKHTHERPSAVFRPALSIDGDQWCALYGANLQDGVAGFGRSPADAMRAFDTAWSAKLPAVTPNAKVTG